MTDKIAIGGSGKIGADVFKIRIQLVQVHKGVSVEALDSFLMDVPERVWGVHTSKSETPFLVAQGFFDKMRKRLGK